MPEQARLDVLATQRLAQEWVGQQVDLSNGQIVRSPPVGVDRQQLVVGRRCPPGFVYMHVGRSKIKTWVQPGCRAPSDTPTRSSHTRSARFTGPQGASGTRRMHLVPDAPCGPVN